MAEKEKQTTEKNVRVEKIVHAEERDEPGSSDAQEEQYAEITAAVQKQMEKNNKNMLKQIEDKSQDAIKEAVKCALER